jgi:hypothetical protein
MVMLEAGPGTTDPGTNCYNESLGDATSMQRQWQEGPKCAFIPINPFPGVYTVERVCYTVEQLGWFLMPVYESTVAYKY